jgi:S-adenosylmethionine:tRNA ribosyltransferase-isomerase
MKTIDFDYNLPDELIANYPMNERSSSRLLVSMERLSHRKFKDIVEFIDKGDLLILNNTSVIPARIFGKKESGGLIEVMLERFMENNEALVQIRSGRSPKVGSVLFVDKYKIKVIDRKENFFIIKFNDDPLMVFNEIGHVPLPPYIKRTDEEIDQERYATVYEDKKLQESVAAPTAGLHFDKKLLNELKNKGVQIGKVNLSVGAGTFQPVKVDNIEDHDIHSEYLEVKPEIIDLIESTKAAGKKVIAVGTTATRAIETAYLDTSYKGYKGYTKLFITPGYKYKAIDKLITNFHLPQSSLLMLVAAFIGYEKMKEIYKIAVEEKYRFLSYGDAMLLEKNEI